MQIPGYRIVRKIDQGGMSTVYLATQLSVGREVALKVMSPALNADPVFSKRFQREANIVGQLSHPNIVSIYDIGCYKNLNYIAMDYLPGGTVHDRMKTELSIAEIMRIIREIARALDVAHSKGYVHRDIKPENILFREDGTSVLSDFGVAKAISSTSQTTNAGLVVGTPHYMSPEQSRGMAIDGRSDIYSLGIVFYEMLTGTVPYKADEAVAIAIKHVTAPIPTLPPQFSIYQPLLNRFIAKNAGDRFQNGRDIVQAIEQLENTLSGTGNTRSSMTDPNHMNVMALFKALLLTTYAVLRSKFSIVFNNMIGWRWTPKRGFYHHPKTKVTEIKTNIDSGEDARVTIISTRIRNAMHYQDHPNRKLSYITRAFMFLFVLCVVWSALSVGLVRFNIVENNNANLMTEVVHATAAAIENYAGGVTGEPKDSGAQAATESQLDTLQTVQRDEAPNTLPHATPTAINESNTAAMNSEEAAAISITDDSVIADAPEPVVIENVFYPLLVEATPADATIRILNIRERYQPNIRLEPGRYQIEVAHDNYHPQTRWVTIQHDKLVTQFSLQKKLLAGESIIDTLQDGSPAPEMIILPIGSFKMGDKNDAATAPEHQVNIKKRIAASKYEVTFAAYEKFARDTGRALPNDEKWGGGSRPVINVNWYDANEYATWLSNQTGKTYRLPTEAEWEFMARANTKTANWWGDKSAEGKANCRRGCKSEYAGVFSSKTAPVGSYPANAFGLFDTSGNVAEWTMDCYQNHYIGAPTDGSHLILNQCTHRSVRGGSMKSGENEILSTAREGATPESKSETIGIRLVLELEEN